MFSKYLSKFKFIATILTIVANIIVKVCEMIEDTVKNSGNQDASASAAA